MRVIRAVFLSNGYVEFCFFTCPRESHLEDILVVIDLSAFRFYSDPCSQNRLYFCCSENNENKSRMRLHRVQHTLKLCGTMLQKQITSSRIE